MLWIICVLSVATASRWLHFFQNQHSLHCLEKQRPCYDGNQEPKKKKQNQLPDEVTEEISYFKRGMRDQVQVGLVILKVDRDPKCL